MAGEAVQEARGTTGSRTMAELLARVVAEHGDRAALRYKLGDRWVDESYGELDKGVSELGRGLIELGIQSGDRVAILAHTRPEWTRACFATLAAGAIVVSVYQTNSAEECQYVLAHSGSRAVFVEDAEQLAKLRAVQAELPALESVIVFESDDADADAVALDELRARGRRRPRAELEQRSAEITPDDVCLFIYTSGTTGPPKGCELTHGNWRSIVSAVHARRVVEPDDVVYLFLPLAHALALLIQFIVLDLGATIAYWQRDPQKIVADIVELKPTFFPSVPRMFEKIYTLAMSAAPEERLERAIRVGVEVREARREGAPVPEQLEAAFEHAEQELYGNVRNLFGGRLRQAVTGAAPIEQRILEFFYACGVPVMEGYGLTETTGVATVNTPDAFRFGSVGRALPGVDVQIAADGEVLIKGPNIFPGYYKDEAATRQARSDGWLYSGDVGRLDEDGYLFITGRKKDIIITAGGKNVSPANLEQALQYNRWISHAIVVGDGRPYLVALLTLDPEQSPAFAQQHGLEPGQLHQSREMRAELQQAIDEVNSHVGPVEQIKRFAILPNDLSQQTGELTPTLKVKRNIVQRNHAADIDAIYADE